MNFKKEVKMEIRPQEVWLAEIEEKEIEVSDTKL